MVRLKSRLSWKEDRTQVRGIEGGVADVDAVDQDAAGIGIAQAHQQRHGGALARTGGPTSATRVPGGMVRSRSCTAGRSPS